MKYEINYRPAFATIFVTLQPQEKIIAEAGAMVSMDAGITMKTQLSGGLIPAFVRKFLGGESLFVNVFENNTSRTLQVILNQSMIGDIEVLKLENRSICVERGAYIAHAGKVTMGVKWAGFRSWFAGEGLFKLQFNGTGRVMIGAYGGITKKEINGEFIVDTSHLVAYDSTIKMSPALSGNLFSSWTSGEGFVNKLQGKGTIYLQSRSVKGLIGFLRTKLR